jgi:hypothetical protein
MSCRRLRRVGVGDGGDGGFFMRGRTDVLNRRVAGLRLPAWSRLASGSAIERGTGRTAITDLLTCRIEHDYSSFLYWRCAGPWRGRGGRRAPGLPCVPEGVGVNGVGNQFTAFDLLLDICLEIRLSSDGGEEDEQLGLGLVVLAAFERLTDIRMSPRKGTLSTVSSLAILQRGRR